MVLSPGCKIWVEKEGRKVFGEGPCDILKRIKRAGSLRMAAAEINMSYSQAWKLIANLEKNLGFPLLIKKAGGEAGGGSVLTDEGELFVGRFEQFHKEMEKNLQQVFNKYFAEKSPGKVGL